MNTWRVKIVWRIDAIAVNIVRGISSLIGLGVPFMLRINWGNNAEGNLCVLRLISYKIIATKESVRKRKEM